MDDSPARSGHARCRTRLQVPTTPTLNPQTLGKLAQQKEA
jgi:hypothetical protein